MAGRSNCNISWLFASVRVSAVMLVFVTTATGEEFDPFLPIAWPSVPLKAAAPVIPAVDPFDQLPMNAATAVGMAPAAGSVPIHKLPTTAQYPVKPTVYTLQPTTAVPILPTPLETAGTLPSPLAAGCGTPNEKPLGQLSIGVEPPQGEVPTDRAAACWQSLNSADGGYASARYWAQQSYVWDATCMAHRPLYFEEINLERYGYGCHDCLQPFASAAHFFATVPALPYCMAADCPGECQYTLGHYRPGSCPPWRCHRPPLSTRGGISEAGVLTGLIFLIP